MTSIATLTTSDEVLRILKDLRITPRGVQQTAIDDGLLDGESIMVCSPTGSGKTFIGEMALLRAVTEGKKGLYIVPLKALAVQVAQGLRKRYERRNISIGESHGDFQLPGDELAEFDIIVTTYERTDSLLRHKAAWLSKIGTVVTDEIQNLSEERRGPRLESVILRLKNLIDDIQVVALSATVGEPHILANWLGCKLVQSFERPVPLHCGVVYKRSREEAIKELVMTTIQKDGQVIVFHRTRREAEVDATRLAESVTRHLTPEERSELTSSINSVEHRGVVISSELKAVIHNGVAFHHAGLSGKTRRLIETLFMRGNLRVICATTTLASGMNLPARTVIIATARSPSDYRKLLSANKIHQMLGRAGRPGKDNKGFGIILAESQGEADELRKRYFIQEYNPETKKHELKPRYNPITSVIDSHNALTEQLLVALDHYCEASLEDIELGFFGNSYLFHHAMGSEHKPMRIIQLGEVTAASALERHAYTPTIREARAVTESVKLREVSDYAIGGIVSMHTCRFSIRKSLSGEIEGPLCSCEKPIDSRGILCSHLVALGFKAIQSFKSKADYIIPLALSESSPSGKLIRLGLVQGGDDGKLRPTKMGKVVNRLYLGIQTINELLLLIEVIDEASGLLDLLKHLICLETGQDTPEHLEQMLAMVITTHLSFEDIAKATNLHLGDMFGLLEKSRWLAYAISTVAKVGNMVKLSEIADNMILRIEARLKEEDEYDD
jgi:superfamily II DNA/RNA helicase